MASTLRYRAFRAYQKLPEPLKRTVGRVIRALPPRVRYGADVMQWVKFVSESESWDVERLEAYRFEQLQARIARAYAHVPYYRRRMDELGIHPSDITTPEAMRRFPIMDRAIVREHRDEMLADNIPESNRLEVSTSGSSQTPLRFPCPAEAQAIERAFIMVICGWSGYGIGDPLIQLRSVREVDRLATYDAAQNWTIFKLVALDDELFAKVADTAEDFKPKAILGYPSMLYALACSIEKQNLAHKFRSVKVCFGASEKVFQFQRAKVTAVLGAVMSEWYGMCEQVALFGWCPECECLHDLPQHSFTQILDTEGNEITQEGVVGHIVGTSYLNDAFPFINYRTDDMATISNKPSKCGRPYRCIEEVHGRCGDFLLAPSGRVFSPTTLEYGIRHLVHVRDVQIRQVDEECLLMRIVPENGYDKSEGEAYGQAILERIGEPMKLAIELVDTIERPGNQKKRLIVSELGYAAMTQTD